MGKSRQLWLSALFVALLLVAPAFSEDSAEDDEYADEDKALLIARKTVVGSDVIVGGNTTVLIEIYNAGTSSAYAVEVTDASDPRLPVASGSLRARFEKVPPGGTVQHTYHVKPAASGSLHAQPAVIKYKPDSPTSTDIQTVRSTDATFTVLTKGAKLTKMALTLGKWTTFGNFHTERHWITFIEIVLAIVVPVGGYFSYLSVSEGRKRAKYQRALQEVEKMK